LTRTPFTGGDDRLGWNQSLDLAEEARGLACGRKRFTAMLTNLGAVRVLCAAMRTD